MRPVLALAVLLCLSAAGCGDDGGEGADGGGPAGDHDEHGGVAPIQAPAWQVGQWWTISAEQAESSITYVVSADAGADWIVDTDSQEVAFFDARVDLSMVGPVRKTDLAGAQGDDRVQFFQFPLTLNGTWTTRWDGMPITVTVVGLDAAGAELEARHANGTLYAAYTYDVDLAYFGEFAFYAADGQTVRFAATVTDTGQAFDGELVRWTLDGLFEMHGPLQQRSSTFQVEPGYTDIWVDVHIACAQQGAFTVTFGPPTGPAEERGFTATGPCPTQVGETSTVLAPTANEPWGVFLASAPPDVANLDLTILGRTLTTFAAGSPP